MIAVRCLLVSRAALVLAAVFTLGFAVAARAYDLGPVEPVRIRPDVSVAGANIRLGDLFTGHPDHEDKIVAPAPLPGERVVFDAAWLANTARSYGVDWTPAGDFDRVVVTRPGKTVTEHDLLTAVTSDLRGKGLPANFALRPSNRLPLVTVPAGVTSPVTIRESVYDPTSKEFAAVAAIDDGDGTSRFVEVRGRAIATIAVPVLKADATHSTVITAEMLDEMNLPEDQLTPDTVTDADSLIGKSPRGLLRAGQPIRDGGVARLSLVDVPVLRHEMSRQDVITRDDVTWITVNADTLTNNSVTTGDYLIGKSPRHVVAGGSVIQRSDVSAAQSVMMAVAAHDLPMSTPFLASDINWVPASENDLVTGVILDKADLVGRTTTRPIRAGEPIRNMDVVKPTVIQRGKAVTIVYATPLMTLTVQGEAMEPGALGETIHVTNTKSSITVLAEVVDANTVRVSRPLQSAMR